MRQDLRFALRLLLRQPLLTAAAVLTLAFGVGANTAIVSVLETVLLNPLGLPHSDRVMVATVRLDKLNMDHAPTSGVEFAELSAMPDAFSSVAALESRVFTADISGAATRLIGQAVTPGFFHIFLTSPAAGRFFTADDRDGVVLSHALWQAQYAADPAALGRTILLDGARHSIIGVAPANFRFPVDAQLWTPLVLSPERMQRRGNNMNLILLARVKPGVTSQQALSRVARHVAALKSPDRPDGPGLAKSGYGVDLDAFSVYVAGDLRRPLWLLAAAALLVLLTGCANVAGLLFTRHASRRREIAIRLSLGATPLHILRQLLLESLLLGLAGGAAGLLVARIGIAFLSRVSIRGGSMLALAGLNMRLLLYGVALALVSGLLFGLAPALQLLRSSHTAEMARSGRRRFQDLFVTAEVAAAFVLVVMTGLLLQSLWAVQRIQPGFDPAHLTTAYLIKPPNDAAFARRLEAALQSQPGIESAAMAYPLPFTGGGLTSSFSIRNRQRLPGEPEWHGEAYFVSPNYLPTLRIPLQRGRNFQPTDAATAPVVCIIDAKLAAMFFRNQDPIGQEIAMYRGWARIVGVAANIRGTTLEAASRPTVYYALDQIPFFPQRAAIVRSQLPAAAAIRELVRQVNPAVPVFDIRTMEDRIAESLGIRRVMVALLISFGAVSLLLAVIGIYGVVAQLVAERTREIGIRVALGAAPRRILTHFLTRGLRAGLAGLALGIAAAIFATRALSSMLYQTRAADPVTFSLAAAVVLILVAAAVSLPARRAAAIDAQDALRHE